MIAYLQQERVLVFRDTTTVEVAFLPLTTGCQAELCLGSPPLWFRIYLAMDGDQITVSASWGIKALKEAVSFSRAEIFERNLCC